jgi:KTSC domain-containing protein
VASSPLTTLSRYAYDPDRQRLHIEFRNRDTGFYSFIPAQTFAEFEQSTSKGTFLREHLRNNRAYPWTSVFKAPRYQHGCAVCGASRTLTRRATKMPKHNRKGATTRCPESDTPPHCVEITDAACPNA